MQRVINPKERTDLIEVEVLNVGAQEFTLGTNPKLREATKIFKIEAFNFTQIPVSPSGKVVINITVFNKSAIKLINNANTELRAVPLYSISKNVNGTEMPFVDTNQIDPEKSKIVVGSAAGLVLNEVFLLAVTYERP